MNNFVKSNIKKYYFVSAISGFSFTTAITILYYRSFGLSFFQISLLESIFLITILLFQIPTGAIADKYGRKKSIVAGAFILPITPLIIGFSSSFWLFAFAMVFFGIGAALISGAQAALIYDMLREAQEEKAFVGINGKSFALFFIFTAISAPIGSHLFVINRRLPFYLDAIVAFIVFLVYLVMQELKAVNKSESQNHWTLIRNGAKQALLSPQIRWYALFGILISLAISVFASLIGQPLIVHQGVSVANLGYVIAASALIQAFTSYYAEMIEKKIGENMAITLIFLIPGIAFIAMSVPSLFILIPFYMVYVLAKGFQYPILGSYLQKHISSDVRATVLSIWGLISSLSGALLLPVFGYIADRVPITTMSVLLGVVVLVSGMVLFFIKPKKRVKNLSKLPL